MQEMLWEFQLYYPSPGKYLWLQWVECHSLSLCHVIKPSSTLKRTVLANYFCQRLNTFYSQYHKDFSVQQCQKCLGILLGFIYISLDVVRIIFLYVKRFLQNLSLAVMVSRRITGSALRVNSFIFSLALLSG